ncbi:hypothetical protein PSP6_170066 [Paraburkholderia tropica]|nr:hypothetical protein PSP6_170066 [Paraburkholderia tropica]
MLKDKRATHHALPVFTLPAKSKKFPP